MTVLHSDNPVKSVRCQSRGRACQLAHDSMKFAATSYNAIQDRDEYDELTVERSQWASPGSVESDGQLVCEWAIFPDQGATWAARVTVSEETVDRQSQVLSDEDMDYVHSILF